MNKSKNNNNNKKKCTYKKNLTFKFKFLDAKADTFQQGFRRIGFILRQQSSGSDVDKYTGKVLPPGVRKQYNSVD